MADLVSIGADALIPLTLGGESFALRVPAGATAQRLRRAFGPCVDARVRRGARRIFVDVELVEPPTFTQVIAAVFRAAAAAAFPDLLFFHAAAVASPTGATLFIAPSGAGKTTIACAAARLGLGVLADDVACVRVADRRVVASLVRLHPRDAMLRLLAPPKKKPSPSAAAPLSRVVLLGAGSASTSAFVGREALVSQIDPPRRWEAVCLIAELLEGTDVRRMPRLDLDRPDGVRAARERLRATFLGLGARADRVDALLPSRRER